MFGGLTIPDGPGPIGPWGGCTRTGRRTTHCARDRARDQRAEQDTGRNPSMLLVHVGNN
jgi:hypothetical protein